MHIAFSINSSPAHRSVITYLRSSTFWFRAFLFAGVPYAPSVAKILQQVVASFATTEALGNTIAEMTNLPDAVGKISNSCDTVAPFYNLLLISHIKKAALSDGYTLCTIHYLL